MTRITEQYGNVRVLSTGMGLDDSDTVQYFNGTEWVDYLTVYQFEDNMKSKRDKTVDMLRAKYPEPKKPTKFVASVRPTAFRKDRDETHTFATRDEALAFIKTNTDFCFTEVSK